MKSKRLIIFVFFLIAGCTHLHAQLVLTDLRENTNVMAQYKNGKGSKSPYRVTSAQDTVNLPFIDDFSKGYWPRADLWLDSNVYINNNYPINPPTIGVVTFDGLDKHGAPYNLNNPTAQGAADSLTSRLINLGTYFDTQTQTTVTYTLSDSVYLSFFYEGCGLGNSPDVTPGNTDSLVVQFTTPNLGYWQTMQNITFSGDSSHFKQVFIKIDTLFMKKGFQFRFRNYATLSGNLDHWHIDYVRLARQHGIADTAIDDVAFVKNLNTILTPYTAMPWWQFTPQNQIDSMRLYLQNNSNTGKTISNYTCNIVDGSGTTVYTSTTVPTISSHQRKEFSSPLPPNKISLAPSPRSYTSYKVFYTLQTSPDVNHNNDSVVFDQPLYNYFSYDDGTAENGIGANVDGAQVALKFVLNKPDTLVAVAIHFEHLLYNLAERNIHIVVWKDTSQNPVYTSGVVHPQYGYGFYQYQVPPLPISGTFYVGWEQESADIMNVGFDRNTNSSANLFYNIGNHWRQAQFKGSAMIRPVFGDASFVGIDEKKADEAFSLKIYPNPCTDNLFIDWQSARDYQYFILNTLGQVVKEGYQHSTVIAVNDLPQGLYLLKVSSPALSAPAVVKFIISR